MPELPEVETTVRGLQKKVLKRTFIDAWSDWQKMVRHPRSFARFKKELRGKNIVRVWRRAKNVIFELSHGHSLLIHQKMTGHLMVGRWKRAGGEWLPKEKGPLEEKINLYIHFIFFLDNGEMIALSDYRKFAKVELWKTSELFASAGFLAIGPEPLEKGFTLEAFKDRLQKKRGRIKQVIMDPAVVAGIGNIYASEALWWAKIHPERSTSSLQKKEMKSLYQAVVKVLKAGIAFGGESFADYRNVDGEKGRFDGKRRAYKREKLPCFRCRTPLRRAQFGGRSAFFCPNCQVV